MKSFLNTDKITKANLEGLAFELLKNKFKNSVELKYNLEQCYLIMTERIDYTNLERDRFHTDMSKPLPLEGPPGRNIIPMRYLFNKDIEYLMHGNEEKYALSLSTIKAARCGQEWIEEMIHHLSSPSIHNKTYGYRYLKEIMVKRADLKEYTFAEADFPRMNKNNIEDLYLLKIQDKVHNLVGFVYLGNDKKKMTMRADEIHKFSYGTLNKVYDKLNVMVRDNRFGYGNEAMKDHV
uniref:Uncharacterized protein n=1 Tax=Tanacetum cinerariifolium TaxID=118510 RepID=A0A6L2MKR7_TANCI|nr:hypothetical protein CTI12_AA475510 [Tanacetum cinerariifolium]